MATRRKLTLTDLRQVISEAETLHRVGYTKAGQWDLGKICDHICNVVEMPVKGFGDVGMPWYIGLVQPVLGPLMKRYMLSTNRMVEGAESFPGFLPPEQRPDDDACVQRLRDAVERLEQHSGPLHPHPFFGTMSKAEVNHLQALHAGHHLSFLVPNPS